MVFDPIIYFFLLGIISRLVKSDLYIPRVAYDMISIYLLISIGLKGGIEVREFLHPQLMMQAGWVILYSALFTLIAFGVMKLLRFYSDNDAACIAAHYGSVSIVTYAVASAILINEAISYEPYMPLFLALMEFPAIIVGAFLLQQSEVSEKSIMNVLHEAFTGKSIFLLLISIVIGVCVGHHGIAPIKPFFIDMFKGVLALFLIQMGIVVGEQMHDIRRNFFKIVTTGILLSLIGAALGLVAAMLMGLSQGGAILLMTLGASASYVAVPASLSASYPKANLPLALSHSLGVTFPFNVLIGIKMYMAVTAYIF